MLESGLKGPLFFCLGMDQLADIVQQYLKPGMVLIDLQHNRQTDLIKVTIDGEEPLNIGDTEALARSLRVSHELVHQFPHGFQLEVSTSGIYSPLIEPYQFRKNKGRILIVEYVDNKIQKQEQSYIDQFRKSLYSGIISGAVFYFLQSSSVDVTEKMLSGPM